MAGAAPTYPPLDLDALRTAVTAGRTVRVGVLPTGQFPDGTAGRVRTVGAPEVDGPEFIQVELMVGGAKDVVPFAPADLSPLRRGQAAPEPVVRPATARRGRPTTGDHPAVGRRERSAQTLSLVPPPAAPRRTTAAAAATPGGLAPGAAGGPLVATAGRQPGLVEVPAVPDGAVADRTTAAVPSLPAAPPARPRNRRTVPAATSAPDVTAAHSGPGSAPAVVPSTAPRARRAGERAKRAQITVTLTTTEPDHTAWTVEVTVGSRTVVKPSTVPPAQAWTVVTGLGHPEVEKHVAGALAEHRRQTQERADRLARELADARAELAGYPDV